MAIAASPSKIPKPVLSVRNSAVSGRLAFFQLRAAILLALLLAVLAFYILQSFSLSIETLQTILFPVFGFLFFRLYRGREFQLPAAFVVVAFGGWIIGGLHIRGYIPSLFSDSKVMLSSLQRDPEGKLGRELFRRYNVIARAYELPSMDILVHTFERKDYAQHWISGHEGTSLLITGDPEWLGVQFPTSVVKLGVEALPPAEIPAEIKEIATGLRLPLDGRVILAKVSDLSVPVVLALLPDSISLPGDPSELSRHFLGWLARGISPSRGAELNYGSKDRGVGTDPEFPQLQLQAFRVDAFSQTTMMLGAWRSPEPISFARHLLGTLELLQSLASSGSGIESVYAAGDTLRSAQKTLRKERHPELYSLVMNMYNLARFLTADSEEDLSRVRREFVVLGNITDSRGNPTAGAIVAMLNLEILENAGVL